MNSEDQFRSEQLPSGKVILRQFDHAGHLVQETHSHGLLAIALQSNYENGVKKSETYFSKRRMVSLKTYEARRASYSDMPAADATVENWGGGLMRDVRAQQRQNKADAKERLRQSQESQFPRPKSTNWLRVMTDKRAHLVVFASRDWKVLCRETELRTGRDWLGLFGFHGVPGDAPSIHKGVEIGYEVTGNRLELLHASKRLLEEVNVFAAKPPEPAKWLYSIAPRPKRSKPKPQLAWPTVLPPLIEFLSELNDSTVKIYNHHQ